MHLRHASQRTVHRGTTAVEFAVTAPILFLFLFATLEFGRYNMLLQTANNCAYEAARACIVPGATASGGQTAGTTYLNAARISGGTVSVSPGTITRSTSAVSATVSVPVSQNLWAVPVFLGAGTITKSCTMATDWTDLTH